MTTSQIAQMINANANFMMNQFGFDEAKVWEKYGKVRIYIGTKFVDIKDGKATASFTPSRQGFYERNDQYIDRLDAEKKLIMPINVVARYVNILLNK